MRFFSNIVYKICVFLKSILLNRWNSTLYLVNSFEWLYYMVCSIVFFFHLHVLLVNFFRFSVLWRLFSWKSMRQCNLIGVTPSQRPPLASQHIHVRLQHSPASVRSYSRNEPFCVVCFHLASLLCINQCCLFLNFSDILLLSIL